MIRCYTRTCRNEATVQIILYDKRGRSHPLGLSCVYHTNRNKHVAMKVEEPIRQEARYILARRSLK